VFVFVSIAEGYHATTPILSIWLGARLLRNRKADHGKGGFQFCGKSDLGFTLALAANPLTGTRTAILGFSMIVAVASQPQAYARSGRGYIYFFVSRSARTFLGCHETDAL